MIFKIFFFLGINDVITPFVIVFIQDYCSIDIETLKMPKEIEKIQ
jgi:hypothetical protein